MKNEAVSPCKYLNIIIYVLRTAQNYFLKKGKLTNTVVYANESEHNPHQATFMTRAGYGPKNLQFLGLREGVLGEYVVRVRVRTYAAREMQFSGMLPVGVLGKQD